MPDDDDILDNTVTVAVGGGDNDDPSNGDDDMAEVHPTIALVLDQAYSRAHEDWLGTRQLASSGDQFMNETNRWSMQAAASNQLFLAGGILAQRSAQAQPQQAPGAGGTGVPAGMKLVPA